MEILQELVQILNKRSLRSLELIGPYLDENYKVNIFYEKMIDGQFESDNEASAFFYDSNANNPNYKSLKANLKKRLINALFFLNLKEPNYNDYEQSYFYCCKYLAMAKILIRLQATKSGMNLCEKVFKKAIKNEFPGFMADSARYLRGFYGVRKGNIEKFNFYNESYKIGEQNRIAENLAQEFYIKLMLPYAKEKASKEQTHASAKEFAKQLEPHLENAQSSYLFFLYFYINIIIHMSINDFVSTVETCAKAIDYFESKPYVYKTALNVFFHNKIVCHTQLRQYEEGIEIEKKTLKYLRAGTYNWYRDREIFFILSMHTKNYQAAYEKFYMALKHRRFRFLSNTMKETWRIYEAYLHFFVFMEKVIPRPDDKRFNKFKLGKFLNSVPVFSKDKRGFNIPILIIQILFMIIKKDYDKVADRIDAIEKYCSRHVRKKDHFRSNIFIKMLLVVPRSGFHKAGIERKVEKYRKQLETVPLEVASQIHEVEIIPYEHLWEIIMESLETKFHRFRASRAFRQR